MTADEHRARAEELLSAAYGREGRPRQGWATAYDLHYTWRNDSSSLIAAAQAHTALAQAAEQADLLRGLRSIAQGQADQADAHRAAEIERRGFLGRLFGGGR